MIRPDLSLERVAWAENYRIVAGIDEAGRGAWAGPVAAAAVVLPPDRSDLCQRLAGVMDSKLLTPQRREALFPLIQREALAVGVGLVEPDRIVADGIAASTRQAMQMALAALAVEADYLLIDYIRLPEVALPQKSIRKGDQKSYSIAAASIVAKVTRDRLMIQWAEQYPEYGFERHKGYGTRAHRQALSEHGLTPLHRYTWKPFEQLGLSGQLDHSSA